MGYVQAGYSIVLGILFLYGLQLVWRRRRLNQAVARVTAAEAGGPGGSAGTTTAVRATGGAPVGRPAGER